MKVSSVTMPERPFQILRDGNSCTVEFFDNVKSSPAIDGMTGQSVPSWDYEKYDFKTDYKPGLAAQIESNYDTWLQKAKAAEIASEGAKVRNYRDNLLNQCDLQYCNSEKWAAMAEDKQKEWTAYKQALRDVPIQSGFPYSINWPTMPKE